MRPFIVLSFALSGCAGHMSAPVAVARTTPLRTEAPLLLSRFELTATSPSAPTASCAVGPSELDCETKLWALRAEPSKSQPHAEHGVFSITREDGSVLYAQALRTGVSQARLRSSLPVTARR